ncbi:ABC transporter substrate-binding protein [Aureimonas pseudogalii]|uniref:Peptide/nickel transport system substrate-binding protein n=1 Tax=Aureimonas pseudogalii TaxID=1744844 RepID=A0A7W6EC34_9HYPH|nr:ABC transporter substrate-binding protein [Aureimonas pseudogalii]MBB3997286.1 peptide/nickel transport system substrate-binding protein [Aureimonas pseudogalii]
MTRSALVSRLAGPLLVGVSLLAPLPAVAADRVFDIVAPFEIGGADPSLSGFIFQRMQVGETLVEVDREGRPRPGLAKQWTISPDGLTWTLPIRAGVRFHDGTMLTADLAAASLDRARSKPGVLERARIESIAAENGAVVIRLAEPFAPLWALLAHFSTIVLAPSSLAGDGTVSQVVATGPYRITRFEPPQRLEVAAFADYWGGKPAIEAATYLAAGRGETRTLMIEGGDADLAFQLDPPSIARLKRNGAVDVLKAPLPRVMQLKVNAAMPPFDNVEGRTALSEAIQREGLAAALLRAPGTGATQLFPPSVEAWHDPALAPLATDPERARARLAALGWVPGADGIAEKDGRPLRVKLLTYADRPELPLIATALQDQLRQVGIDVEVSVTNASSIPAGHADGTLQLALAARNYSLVPDPFVTLLGDFREGGSDWGSMNWDDPAFHQAMRALLASNDPSAQAQLRHEIAAILQRDLPVIPVVWYEQTAAVTKAVEGAAIDPFERSFGLAEMAWKP